ncbi:MAG: hypothetical protein COU63_01450 [Candidatus Pacebacteria bacterium CG10_big_fil_rev_8_21_14_0_10_36_11]|nr:NUDIX domain-containing protein [Candidatus Pacearchaeota archaeon]OIP73747.1 MAG: hypothetical protein AUK08_04270 [Candidatus Pacebacteria bacterium CG2_30_36_39]PIR64667.1 MAG: hypothetical protein COU63_01450 [Candidatus Pacebacteria bacterium CG10_big_fil_rev_8_21_14_0_10_36_11]PJC42736.1 MAG: hypothetical protein CO040_02830 [Candidatus Pacebacteria bacterium CG_4_9_14_0_2_um_filter_36_8]
MNKVPHQLTENVKFLHKVAIIHQDKVLVLKRPSTAASRPGSWDLPGGNVEWPAEMMESGRNLHQAEIAREVIEETGLEVLPEVFELENMVHFFSYYDERKAVYSIVCGWVVKNLTDLRPDQVLLSDEHTEYRWVTADEANSLNFGEPVGSFVKTIVQQAFKA